MTMSRQAPPSRAGSSLPAAPTFPQTRYQGSKRKLCSWLWSCLETLEFETALDAFGGTGSVSHLLKAAGKRVTYNDILRSNEQMAIALIENDGTPLTEKTMRTLRQAEGRCSSPSFIADNFSGIYFTDEENGWLDGMCRRIRNLPARHERAIAWYALFQAALIKRPYNLFHRRNLYMRTADVARSFGNKRTWDRPFAEHFSNFVREANKALIDGRGSCVVLCGDAAEVPGVFDLVYVDPPYINGRGTGVDYAHFYHFLEGMLDYDRWGERIDRRSRHLRLHTAPSPWTKPGQIGSAFARLLERFRDAVLVISYRSDGIPSITELVRLLRRHKRRVRVHERQRYQYALSRNARSHEVLIAGQ